MVKADHKAVKNDDYFSNREFVCGLVEVVDNRIKLNINSDFLAMSESGIAGVIPLDPGDDAASVDKMRAAAEYFAELAQDLRQATKLYRSGKAETVMPVEAEAKPRNQQQQTEHLEKIHAILEQLPEAEKAIYQRLGFAERARMYKLVDYETDPVRMQTIICTMIKATSEGKDHQP
jgi:polyribonucleotide nucleotidyltransferase